MNVFSSSSASSDTASALESSVSERLMGLRRSNQDVLRQSRINLRKTAEMQNSSASPFLQRGYSRDDAYNQDINVDESSAVMPTPLPLSQVDPILRSSQHPSQDDHSHTIPSQYQRTFDKEVTQGMGLHTDEVLEGGGSSDAVSAGQARKELSDKEYESDESLDGSDSTDAAAEREELDAIIATAAKKHESEVRIFCFQEGQIGLTFSSFSACDAEFHKEIATKTPGANILVSAINRGGIAETYGVRSGDLIVSFNAQEIPEDLSIDDFYQLLQNSPRPCEIGFRFQRDEE